MSIFDYQNYKSWLNDHIRALPKQGRGQYSRIALALKTNPTIITQVFKGSRELTPEQAVLLADYLGMSEAERRFLLVLINHSRAGTHRYKEILFKEMELLQKDSKKILHRVPKATELSEETKSILYSNWRYLAIWSLTAIEEFVELDAIASRLNIPRKMVREALDFLLKNSLVVMDDQGRFRVGPTHIHLGADSPHIARHHQNWRLRAFSRYENPHENDVSYTAAVTLSKSDVLLMREKILKFISESTSFIQKSPSEELYCLCLDWFEV